jgi:inosine/xanthosine triphosphatase
VKLALASERSPKIAAVRAVLARLAALDPPQWEHAVLVAHATPSGVAATPLDDIELRRGARQRVEALAARLASAGEPADLYVGLEGGAHVDAAGAAETPGVWLRSWCYVSDGKRGNFGCGPSVRLPACIAEPVRHGEDLAAVIDRVARGEDLRSQGGTWGFVTRGMVTRQLAFETAVLAALAPFYHPQAFQLPASAAPADPPS